MRVIGDVVQFLPSPRYSVFLGYRVLECIRNTFVVCTADITLGILSAYVRKKNHIFVKHKYQFKRPELAQSISALGLKFWKSREN